MIEIVIKVLACVGGLIIVLCLVSFLVNLHDLFERVDALEAHDNVRRNDIIEVKNQIVRMKEKLE